MDKLKQIYLEVILNIDYKFQEKLNEFSETSKNWKLFLGENILNDVIDCINELFRKWIKIKPQKEEMVQPGGTGGIYDSSVNNSKVSGHSMGGTFSHKSDDLVDILLDSVMW